MRIPVAAAFVLTLFMVGTVINVAAQTDNPNWQAEPLEGTIELSNGFTPDPHTVDVQAGGELEKDKICEGYVWEDAPDVNLTYEAGDYPLTFAAESDSDVTLLIFTPEQQWNCETDSGGTGNSWITYLEPDSGTYNIWIGTRTPVEENHPPATLSITEKPPTDGGYVLRGDGSMVRDGFDASDKADTEGKTDTSGGAEHTSEPNRTASPAFDTVSLEHGFMPDPETVDIEIGGSATAVPIEGCEGYIRMDAPDVNLEYEAGDSPLSIVAQSQISDATLLVYTPGGEWVCQDNPVTAGSFITFDTPESGDYNIWLGAEDSRDHPDDTQHARVPFTEYEVTSQGIEIP